MRWRMPVIVVLLAISALAFVWNGEKPRQSQVLGTVIVLIVSAFLIFVWAVLFSGLRGRARLGIFAGSILIGLALAGSFQIVGVTGDLRPIVRPRWQKRAVVASEPVAAAKTNAIAESASFPQFMGPNRDSIIPGARLETNWTAHPPPLMWRRAVGNAWSGFAIANGLAVTQEQREDREAIAAYDLQTGAPVWAHLDEGRYFTTLGGEGPRATPTIHSNRVYTMGAVGIVNCLELASGKLVWSKNLAGEFKANVPEWGFAGSPLIVGENVVAPANSVTLAAFDLETGKTVWTGGQSGNGYSSPALVNLDGREQIVSFNNRNVSGHDPASGKVLWEYPWPATHPHVTTPIATEKGLLVSSGYGYGSELIEISGTNATRVWKSNRFKSKFANLVRYGDFVYGLDDGILAAMDPATGERIWHDGRVGHGQMLLVGDVLLLMAESGEVQLISPPLKSREGAKASEEDRTIARLKVFDEKTWNPPALAGEFLVARNNLEAACFRVKAR